MRYESLLPTVDEKHKWFELEVTLGTNEVFIDQEISKLRQFLKTFDDLERTLLEKVIASKIDLDSPLDLRANPKLLKLLLVKKFMDRQGLVILREAKQNIALSEKEIFLEIVEALFARGEYPEGIYLYSEYRRRGTPNTWFKVIDNLNPDQVERKIVDNAEKLKRFINRNLRVNRRLRFCRRVGDLLLVAFTKGIAPRVIKGEIKNVEAQGASYTIVVFDKSENKIGAVSGSKREVRLIQRYIRYRLLPESIATPRFDCQEDKNKLLKKLMVSNPERKITISGVEFKRTLLPGQPSLKLKIDGQESLDEALGNVEPVWDSLGIDALRSIDYKHNGKVATAYLYGDDWKRMYINVAAKRRSVTFENTILDDLNERLGVNVKEARFIVEPLTDEYILEKILNDKKVFTFPPVPERVERLLVRLIGEKIIKKPTKMSKRKCRNCYNTSWNSWACPACDREDMVVVGEMVSVLPNENRIVRRLSALLTAALSNYQITLIPYKQRRRYKKSVIRTHNPVKNLSIFILVIANKKDLLFAEDLLREGFGVIAIVDPVISGKIDYVRSMGCEVIGLHLIINKLLNGGNTPMFSTHLENQERRVLERIFSNLRTSVNRLNSKPVGYNEDMFEIDLTNILQAIVPDVIRLGTEHKGKSVPDGYCCYGYRGSLIRRRRKRLFGWDAKYSYSSSYRLGSDDFKKQRGYISWLSSRRNEPYKMGSLGIYAFISNFDAPDSFETTLTRVASWSNFPERCRLILMEDKLLVKVGEWLLDNWRQVIGNNSLSAEEFFRFIRRKRPSRPYNILRLSSWEFLKKRLDQTISP